MKYFKVKGTCHQDYESNIVRADNEQSVMQAWRDGRIETFQSGLEYDCEISVEPVSDDDVSYEGYSETIY